ncbi:hypothetical protein GGE46_002617 [Rhizobium etli]|uniref:Uncharacterized protein n=1 Tax=Rhizobium etli TaxID=29449 RepID=A0A7W6V9D4_RHIET|nr:hypothetical protein [Rhizobium etli]MBB4535639.1 hypothetical protein [Rhizobium etli]
MEQNRNAGRWRMIAHAANSASTSVIPDLAPGFSRIDGCSGRAVRAPLNASLEVGRVATLSCNQNHIRRKCFAIRSIHFSVHIVGLLHARLSRSGVLVGAPAQKDKRWNYPRSASGVGFDVDCVSSDRFPRKRSSLGANRFLALQCDGADLTQQSSQELTETIENYRFSDASDAAKDGASGTAPNVIHFP